MHPDLTEGSACFNKCCVSIYLSLARQSLLAKLVLLSERLYVGVTERMDPVSVYGESWGL